MHDPQRPWINLNVHSTPTGGWISSKTLSTSLMHIGHQYPWSSMLAWITWWRDLLLVFPPKNATIFVFTTDKCYPGKLDWDGGHLNSLPNSLIKLIIYQRIFLAMTHSVELSSHACTICPTPMPSMLQSIYSQSSLFLFLKAFVSTLEVFTA